MSSNEIYRQKYLKYKQKYLDLQQLGGLSFNSFKPSMPSIPRSISPFSSTPEQKVANLRAKYTGTKNALNIAQTAYDEAVKTNKRQNDSKTLAALEKARNVLENARTNKLNTLSEYRAAKDAQRKAELKNAQKVVDDLQKIVNDNNTKLSNAKAELGKIIKKQADREERKARKLAQAGRSPTLMIKNGSVDGDTTDESDDL